MFCRSRLEELLSIVNCSIVSTTRNSQVDAYVLSESSMFISKRRFILKTCGTTTPLDCIEALTKLVLEFAMFDTVEVCNIVKHGERTIYCPCHEAIKLEI